jgi:hypothetical protein
MRTKPLSMERQPALLVAHLANLVRSPAPVCALTLAWSIASSSASTPHAPSSLKPKEIEMLLTQKQAAEVIGSMNSTSKPISFDFRRNGSTIEKVVVHERKKLFSEDSVVLVWNQLGGLTHNEETYSSREAFKAAYQ